eukprot:XP_001706259.1 Hypothetical protein GL50803_6188 [Giardia lamblia ATCC 50803]
MAKDNGKTKNIKPKPTREKMYAMDNKADPTIWEISIKEAETDETFPLGKPSFCLLLRCFSPNKPSFPLI